MSCPSLPRGFFLRPLPFPDDSMPHPFPFRLPSSAKEYFLVLVIVEIGNIGGDAFSGQS